jgi:DNA-binding MarR family transcriptional regulator
MIGKQSDQVLQEQLGIGLAQFKILRMLQHEPRTTQKEIAHHLGQTEASISRQVKLMLEGGLLQSMRSPKDHREHLTVVTPKGERLTEAAFTALARYHQPTFEALSDKQQEQLIAALETLHGQLCHGSHPDPTNT